MKGCLVMNISVNVIRGWSDSQQVEVKAAVGATVQQIASQAGAPANVKFTLNGASVTGTHKVAHGDILVISMGKVDAGC
jgi:hypothetical protein